MENFFYNGCSIDEIEIEELLLFRYHNLDYIMNQDVVHGINIINRAIQERDKDKLWQQWLVMYPYMDEENFISFEDFYDSMRIDNTMHKSKGELLAEAEEIEIKLQNRGGE